MTAMGARVRDRNGISYFGPTFGELPGWTNSAEVEWVIPMSLVDLLPGDQFYLSATGPTVFLVLKPWKLTFGFSGQPLETGVIEVMQAFDSTTARLVSHVGAAAVYRRLTR